MTYIFGERIRLRAAERSDIPLFTKWINDPEVTENLMLRLPLARAEEEYWYENMLKRPNAEHINVVEIKSPPAEDSSEPTWIPIGNTSFMSIMDIDHCAEVGIMLGEKAYWNQGYGTETMRLMLTHGFETLNLHRIWLQVYSKNKRGIRAYEKACFKHEGVFREGHYQHGRYYDVFIMSVLRQEWDQLSSTKGE